MLVPLIRANGLPLTSVVPEASAGSVPQINEFLVLLPPAFTTDRSCAELAVIDATWLERSTGATTSTFVRTVALVSPEALAASKV